MLSKVVVGKLHTLGVVYWQFGVSNTMKIDHSAVYIHKKVSGDKESILSANGC